METCHCCAREFEELFDVCYHCGNPICNECHSNYGGMCESCSELYD